MIVINRQTSGVVLKPDLSALQRFSIRSPEKRCQKLSPDAFAGIVPFYVKEMKILRTLTVLKDIHEHLILIIVSYMIRNDVLYPSHPILLQFSYEFRKVLHSSEFGIYLAWINHIIAMKTPLSRLEDWGRVNVRNAKFSKIWDNFLCCLKVKGRIKLNSICCNRDTRHILPTQR